MRSCGIEPTTSDLQQVFDLKYGVQPKGWGPRMRLHFHYYTPDEYYEAVVAKLVHEGSDWIDVGCGREIFPSNSPLAHILADRCQMLAGLDPDDTLDENPFVHQRIKASIDEYSGERTFSLVTMRMVAEHIGRPGLALKNLARITKRGGKVVIFTVNQWSPVPLITRLIPFDFHHWFKRILWRTDEKDTFPVAYQMNTRQRVAQLFKENGFEERFFVYLDDCRIFARFRLFHFLELSLRSVATYFGLKYPENCLLGVYERV